ncbi:hypothetical protein IscW_ISCW019514 [Ixodes scapularis]|uniref:Uncharacterized protein n=1 Tax=Ixodes scapularis TaxID=6945 RepID=B7PS99_IXOSC|nr:hypothetical protein IscW_ISCW019514 [Ixodes scapularis]|eukprot:XP_002402107.1 hypothetical protein IscW_ISCW019514 [Ixodes scapularis]
MRLQDFQRVTWFVQVAPYTYTTDVWPRLGASNKGPSVFDRPVRQKGRTAYDQVCKLRVVPQTTDPECAVAYRRYKTSSDFKVAAFTGPQQLWQRMVKSYDDNMGDTPIVVYDMDLDDFLDRCATGTMSPLAEALCVGVF